MSVIVDTNLPLAKPFRGKVRDTYDLNDKLLIVATDRISAFDAILPCGIPDKGQVLNQLSAFWFNKTKHIIPNHLIALIDNKAALNKYIQSDNTPPEYLMGRSMIVHKAKRINVEAVVRGYLSGSAWSEYKKTVTISGIQQPKGLQESERLQELLFTPTTKADIGHDLPIGKKELENQLGRQLAGQIEVKSLELYKFARDYAVSKGIIIADTKFEFGLLDDKLILIDELLTPDSSRFWDMSKYKVGVSQPSFDKQPVRDWLENSGWNKEPPAPMLPEEIIERTSERYKMAYTMLVGQPVNN